MTSPSRRSRRRWIAREVRREAPQPVGAGLADEAAVHQPRQLLPHVREGRQRGHLGAAAERLVGRRARRPGRAARRATTWSVRVGQGVACGRRQRVVRLRRARRRVRVDDVGEHGGADVVEQLRRPRGTASPASPSFWALSRPARSASAGDGQRQQQQPAYAEPVAGRRLVRGAEHLSPTVVALVDQRRVSRAPRGRPGAGGLARRCRTSTPSGRSRRSPLSPATAAIAAANARPQRLLERLEVLAPRLLAPVVVDHPEGRPEVVGHLGPVPGLARDDDARSSTRAHRSSASSSGSSPGGTGGQELARLVGRRDEVDPQVLGQAADQAVTSSSRSPGTFQEKSSASTRLRVATGTSMVRPSSAAPGSKW